MNYPGNCATPKETALWMKTVAEEEFGLPGILPVMTSVVELTDAWTSEGCVDDLPGYHYAVDHDSLGFFQQRDGWGTVSQRTDANYALRAFCNAARNLKDYEWDKDTADPQVLGRWCQAVQRSAFPDAYRDKGYPMALELLKDAEPVEWPQKVVEVSSDGYAFIREGENRVWLRGKPRLLYVSDPDGWLTQERFDPPADAWEWPTATEPYIENGTWRQRHPTRWNWLPERPDVEAWARYLVDNYNVSVNTYVNHPEGYWRDKDSFDVWGPAGRGDFLDSSLGDEIHALLFRDPGKPDIDWIVYKRRMWTRGGGWESFGTDDFSFHDDHIHVTYLED